MRQRIRSIFWLIGLVLVSATAILINSVDHILAQELIPSQEHKEEMDDSQIIAPRALQPISPRAVINRGLFQSVQVNVDGNDNNIVGDAANEPSIAIDPTNPNNIVIGWRQFDTITSNFRQAGYAYSDDSGETWTFPGVLDPGQFRSDPVLATDTNGDIFYYSLSSLTSVEMFITRDKGLNWEGPIPSFGGDKAWMTIDTTGGIGNNHIYAIWNSQYTCCAPGTDFTRSIDGGDTYQGPYVLDAHPKWGTLDVGPEGELYIVGATLDRSSHLILKSTNAQNTMQTPVFDLVANIDLGGTTGFTGTPNPDGLTGQVWVAVDRSNLSTHGNVYVLASVDPSESDPLDVHFIRSTDGGSTWSVPIRINADTPGNDAWQWFATMSVSPEGRIDVVWNDTRNDATAVNSELYYAYSTDAGNTWQELPVSPPFNSLVGHPNQNKIGDYYHMISDSAAGNLAFSATFNGEQDVYFLRVGDCNKNGMHDSLDIAEDPSIDCNENGFIDQCEENVNCTSNHYTPVTPCNIVDTRNTSAGIIDTNTQRDFRVYGDGATIGDQGGNLSGCPSPLGEPLAAHINMIAVDPTGKGNLQAFPVGAGSGAGLSVNYNAIDTDLANAGTVRTIAGAGPDITVASNFSSAHVSIQVLGYYYPNGDLSYTPVTPCRIVDTRNTSAGIIDTSTQRDFRVYGDGATIGDQGGNLSGCPSPLGEPLAAHINMIAVNPTGKGNLQAFPVGAGSGAGLSVNYNAIDTNLANAGTVQAIAGLGPDISVASSFASSHAVISVLGYYYPAECDMDTDCDDGLYCNGTETCDGGTCQNGTAVVCDDGIDCTVDSCNESSDVCDYIPDNSLCDDGLFCNGAENCDSGLGCLTDSDPCLGRACDEETDTCVDCLNDGDCDDGLYCNGAEACVDNVCQAGSDPCAGQFCDEGSDTCVDCLNDGDCDDGLFCNGAEACVDDVCQAGSDPCVGQLCDEGSDICVDCLNDGDCDDGLFCNGAETCVDDVCQAGSDPCPGQVCDENSDACFDCLINGDCDDGLYCNGAETCAGGTCQTGTAVVCDDGVDCTVDSCNESSDACDHVPDNSLCDDGLFCNGDENCDSGLGCLTGSDPCSGRACDEDNDICVDCLNDSDCNDGLFCNGAETCVDDVCQAGSDPCPGEFCDEISDQCVAGCQGDFEPDGDVDGSDLAVFAADFGRSDCDIGDPCEGDFDYDNDVDGSDLAVFAADFGRSDCP